MDNKTPISDISPIFITSPQNPRVLDELALGLEQDYPQRAQCYNRGYHKISELSPTDPQLCYHCELFFGKDQGTSYQIIPHFR